MASDINPPRENLARSVIAAAERGDRLAFDAAARRFGTVDEAQELVRNKATLRFVDRGVSANGAQPLELGLEVHLRAADDTPPEAAAGVLYGHFAVWDTWYEVDSFFEGYFLERVVKGATKKTIRENRDNMRVLFQHGMDPVAGDKPLGPIEDLREDDTGAYYEVELLRDDTGGYPSYVADIVPGLDRNLYGSSHRFRVMREEFNYDTEPSDYNPDGLPERTIKEMQVMEFGPVTFPANQAATASLRSTRAEDAPSGHDAAPTRTSAPERRATRRFTSREEFLAWMSES